MTTAAQLIVSRLRVAIVRTGWSETARRAKVDRVNLHRAFPAKPNGRTPNLATVTAVAGALGLRLTISEGP